MTLRVCIIGYGLMGKTHTEMYAKNEYIKDVTVVDIKPEKFPPDNPYRKPIRFMTELVDSDTFDLVSICTPTYLHPDNFNEIAGKTNAVLVEKPLALSSEQSKQIERTAVEKGMLVRCAFVDRFNPDVVEIKNTLERRKSAVHYEFTRIGYLPKSSWYSNRQLSGGALLDLGIHDVDLLLWLTGAEAESMDVSLLNGVYIINLRMNNGDSALISTGWTTEPDYFKNAISIKSPELDILLDENQLENRRYPEVYKREIDAFVDEVSNKSVTHLASLEDAIRAIELCETIESMVS